MFQEQNLQQKSLFDPIYDLDYGYNMGTWTMQKQATPYRSLEKILFI